jgi:hypothetical protein
MQRRNFVILGLAAASVAACQRAQATDPVAVASAALPDAPPGTDLQVPGRYYWEPLFRYNNTSNGAEVEEVRTVRRKTVVRTRDMVRTSTTIKEVWDFKSEASVKFKYLGADIGGKINVDYHSEVAREVETIRETNVDTEEEVTIQRTFRVPAGANLTVYRLMFESPAGIVETELLSTEPDPEIQVRLRFGIERSIPGLQEVLHVLQQIHPGEHNIVEWETIRNSIVSSSTLTDDEQFRQLVETLGRTSPSRSNITEWRAIRATCAEILSDWDAFVRPALFHKLLRRFLATHPRRDNQGEWAAIRGVSDQVIQNSRRIV